MERAAFVTGANRGLGLEACRQLKEGGYRIALGSRDEAKGIEAARELDPTGKIVTWVSVDTTRTESLEKAMKEIERRFGRLDVLINNAGIYPSKKGETDTLSTPREDLRAAMEANTFGAFELARLAIPLMRKGKYGRIVNVSSGMGQLSGDMTDHAAYRISKTALNAVTKVLADTTRGENILVNSVCPGWVRTDMGGPEAQRAIPEGGRSIVWAALIPDGGPTGGYFRDGKALDW